MTGSEQRIGAVILAAGLGSRFGQAAKMLAPYAGRPMVRCAAEAALASRAGPVVAVLGAHAEAVSLFQTFAQGGDDADLKAFAAETLPTLEQHKAHVAELVAKP